MDTTKTDTSDLTLMEELLLLCLRNTGDVSSGIFGYSEVSTGNGLAGAVIMELALHLRISFGEAKDVIIPVGTGSTGDDIMDEALEIMKDKKNPTMSDWLKNLNGTLVFTKGIKSFRERLYQRLCDKGILREVKKVIGTKHTFKDVNRVEKVADKIRNLGNISDPTKSSELSDRDYAFLALFYALDKPFQNRLSNCLDINRIFPDTTERATVRKNIEALVNNESSQASEEDIVITTQVSKQIGRKILIWQIKVMTMGIFSLLTSL